MVDCSKGESTLGLRFRTSARCRLVVSTDASFAPGGGLSHGSVVAMIGGSDGTPIMWRSSKQPWEHRGCHFG